MSMLMGNRRPAIPPPSPPASFSPLGTIGAELAENFELMKIYPGSPAERSRLCSIGDRIVAVDGRPVKDITDRKLIVGVHGTEVKLTLERDSKLREVRLLRSLGPMTDGMAAAQENLNVFYSLGNSRGHRGSPWATPEHPSHDNHNHREEMRTPFHSKASSWGGIPSTEAGPGIDFSTRARHGPPAKGFASPLGTPAVSRDQIMRGAASSQGAEEGGGRDACRNAEEVMRLSRAWRLALLGGGTPPAPALQIEAGAASGTHDLHALPTAKSTTSSQPQLLGEGTGGGADELQRGGKPSSSSTTTTSTTPSSHERECRVSEGGNGKGQVLVSWRQGAMDDDEDFWPAKDDGTDDDALHQEAGKDVDAISLVRHSLRKERHPPPPPIIPLSPPDAMPTEPRIKEWLRAHDLQCIEPRLVAAGGGGVEGASLLTESDCDSISMGLSNIRSRLWRALCELRQGHLVPQLRGSHHAASTQNAPSSPSSANHPPPPIQNSPQSSREMPTNVDVGAVSAATAPSPVLLKRSSHESSTFGMADGSPEDSSISPLSWRVLEKREAAMSHTLAILSSLSTCLSSSRGHGCRTFDSSDSAAWSVSSSAAATEQAGANMGAGRRDGSFERSRELSGEGNLAGIEKEQSAGHTDTDTGSEAFVKKHLFARMVTKGIEY